MSPTTEDTWRAFRAAPSERTFAPLYEETNRLVYTICFRILRNPEDAADAFQSAYARLLQLAQAAAPASNKGDARSAAGVSASEPDCDDARSVATRLAVREAENLHKRRGRRGRREVAMEDLTQLTHLAEGQPSPHEAAAQREVRGKVEALISMLPDRYRLPLLLHYLDGMDQTEIARALGQTRGSVRGRIARGLRKLAPLLRRAGLGESAATLAAAATAAHLLSPPASCSAAVVFAQAAATVAAGGGAAAASGGGIVASLKALLGAGAAAKAAVAVVVLAVVAVVGMHVVPPLVGQSWKNSRLKAELHTNGNRPASEFSAQTTPESQGTAHASSERNAPNAPGGGALVRAAGSAVTTATLAGAVGTLYGKVYDGVTGEAVAGARVWVSGTALEVRSGSGGDYELPGVPAGPVRLAAEMPPLRSCKKEAEIAPLDLKPNERRRCPLTLELNPIVTGKIRDLDTAEAIAGAMLTINNGLTVTSDATGTYRIEDLAPDAVGYTTRVQAEAYVGTRVLAHPSANGDTVLNFDLERGVEVAVRVVDEMNAPVSQARVTVWAASENAAGQWDLREGKNVATDEDGRCRVEAISRRHPPLVQAEKTGYESSSSEKPSFGKDGTAPELQIVLKPKVADAAGRFVGTVTDQSGAPVAGVAVRFCASNQGFEKGIHTTTGADGAYSLVTPQSKIVEGGLLAVAQGWTPVWKNDVTPGTDEAPTRVDFAVEPGHWLSGTVVDGSGHPVKDAHVYLSVTVEGGHVGHITSLTTFGLDDTSAQTDAEGRFQLLDLPANSATICFSKSKFAELEGIQKVDQDIRVAMASLGVIRGVVRDKGTGEPVPQFLVKVFEGAAQNFRQRGAPEAFAAADGRFALSGLTAEETYDLRVEAAGYAPKAMPTVHAAAEETAQDVAIDLAQGEALRGAVVDAAAGQALANVTVVYGWPREGRGFQWNDVRQTDPDCLRDSQRVVTGADGAFSFDESDEKGNLYICGSGLQPVIVLPGDRDQYAAKGGELRIALQAGASVSGVCLKNGAVVPEALVRLRDIGSGQWRDWGTVVTDAAGRYHWDGLPRSQYRLEGHNPMVVTEMRLFNLGEKEQKTVNLGDGLGAFALHGKITDGSGAPLSSVGITAEPQFDWDYDCLSAASDETGAYRVEGLRAGEYKVTVQKWGEFGKIEESLNVGEEDVRRDFTLSRFHSVTVTVAFPDSATPGHRRKYGDGVLQRRSEDGAAADGAAAGAIDTYVQAFARDGHFAFKGNMRGAYVLKLLYDDGDNKSWMVVPQTFQIDNRDADVDLGEVAMPAEAYLHVSLNYLLPPPAVPPEEGNFCLLLVAKGQDPASRDHVNATGLPIGLTEKTFGPLAAGACTWTIEAKGYRCDPVSNSVDLLAGETVSAAVTLRPEGLLEARVSASGPAHAPARAGAGAAVTVRSVHLVGPGTDRVLTAQSGFSGGVYGSLFGNYEDCLTGGGFTFHSLPAGTYDLTVEADGFETWHGQRTVVLGEFEWRGRDIELVPVKK